MFFIPRKMFQNDYFSYGILSTVDVWEKRYDFTTELITQALKELSFCHKLKSSDPNIFAI